MKVFDWSVMSAFSPRQVRIEFKEHLPFGTSATTTAVVATPATPPRGPSSGPRALTGGSPAATSSFPHSDSGNGVAALKMTVPASWTSADASAYLARLPAMSDSGVRVHRVEVVRPANAAFFFTSALVTLKGGAAVSPARLHAVRQALLRHTEPAPGYPSVRTPASRAVCRLTLVVFVVCVLCVVCLCVFVCLCVCVFVCISVFVCLSATWIVWCTLLSN